MVQINISFLSFLVLLLLLLLSNIFLIVYLLEDNTYVIIQVFLTNLIHELCCPLTFIEKMRTSTCPGQSSRILWRTTTVNHDGNRNNSSHMHARRAYFYCSKNKRGQYIEDITLSILVPLDPSGAWGHKRILYGCANIWPVLFECYYTEENILRISVTNWIVFMRENIIFSNRHLIFFFLGNFRKFGKIFKKSQKAFDKFWKIMENLLGKVFHNFFLETFGKYD